MPCPPQRDLLALQNAEGSVEFLNQLTSHVRGCHHCQAHLESFVDPLAQGSAAIDRTTLDWALIDSAAETLGQINNDSVPVATPTHPVLSSGGRIGRLRIRKMLGQGSFGTVVLAYDPELARQVAVKVLRADVFASESGQEAQKRLLREARAMAQISHPNVVGVHDIGTIGGQVFVSMEYVKGSNLRQWLAAQDRSASDIIELFIGAANGLAAAHAQGLIHRDFKPANVLVSTEGVAQVADFGLVTVANTTLAQHSENAIPALGVVDVMLTGAGTVVGTALYMSPEQHQRGLVDAASDQFSFCVALYEALYNQRPFAGSTLGELREHVLAGKVCPPPVNSKVPSWILPILRRGLATEPSKRHPSMTALAEALTGPVPPKRRGQRGLQLVGVSLLAAVIAATVVWSLLRSGNQPCEAAGGRAVAMWTPSVQAQLNASFTDASRASSFAPFAKLIGDYANDWQAMSRQSCRATHVNHEQSETILDKRTICLDNQLNYVSELLKNLLKQPTAGAVDSALVAAATLPLLADCADIQRLTDRQPLPFDPRAREAVVEFNKRIAEARALNAIGSIKAAHQLATTALSRPIDHDQSLARAHQLIGVLDVDIGDLAAAQKHIGLAVEYASAAGDDILVGKAWQKQVDLESSERDHHSRAIELGTLARLAFVRGNASAMRFASLRVTIASVLIRQGKVDDGLAALREVGPVFSKFAQPLENADYWLIYGNALVAKANYADAVEIYNKGLASLEETLGRDHIRLLPLLNNLSVAEKNVGNLKEAEQHLLHSRAIIEHNFGDSHRDLVTVLANLGNIQRKLGDRDSARKSLKRAIELAQKGNEPHPEMTTAMTNLAIVSIEEKQYATATEMFTQVLDASRSKFEPGHPRIAIAIHNVGESLLYEEKYEEANVRLLEAKAAKAQAFGTDHPTYASTLFSLGVLAQKTGKSAQAIKNFKAALKIYSKRGDGHPRTLACLRELGFIHESNGSAQKAIDYLQRVIAARRGDDSASGVDAIGHSLSLDEAEEQFALARATWRLRKRNRAKTIVSHLADALANIKPNKGDATATELRTLRLKLTRWIAALPEAQ